MARSEARFTYIFARELYERLYWFVRLRWVAVFGLAVASLAGPRLDLPAVWPSLFIVATVVALYNLFFQWRLYQRLARRRPYRNLRGNAIRQMVMDLAALMVTVHFTGGLQSPLLGFFAFHMAIGTIMIATRIMYLLAGLTSLGALGLYLLERWDVLRFHGIGHGSGAFDAICALNVFTLAAALFGIVYLTDTVTSRFKQRNVDLYRTTGTLRERTAALQDLLKEMKELESRKSHYMRISAHQLRSPLATVKTSLQVLSEGYVPLSSERGRRLIEGAAERVEGLLAIVNDLLDLAKVREGREKAPWSRQVNVNQLLADLFDSQGPFAEERQVELKPDFEGVAVLAWGIPPDLVHAFENLIHNAIKYSHEGGRVMVMLRKTRTAVVIRVVDQGIGIPATALDDVFLEFVRLPNAKRHASVGTGLGLALAKAVLEAHGGRITVSSREGEGSTFTVTLPLEHTPPEVTRLLQVEA